MEGTNILQKSVLEEWVEGVRKAKSPKAKQILRRRIAKKYEVGINYVQGIIKAGAAEGLIRVGEGEKQGGRTWEPINYHELVAGQEERIRNLEGKFDYLLDGIQKVLEDGETMGIHLQHLRQLGRCWTVGCFGETIYLRLKYRMISIEPKLSDSS